MKDDHRVVSVTSSAALDAEVDLSDLTWEKRQSHSNGSKVKIDEIICLYNVAGIIKLPILRGSNNANSRES